MLEFIKFAVKKKKAKQNKSAALDASTKRLSGNITLHNEVVNRILL